MKKRSVKYLVLISVLFLAGCSAGFLGFAPLGDRKEYTQARNAHDAGNYQTAITLLTDYIYKTNNVARREARAYRLLGNCYEQIGLPSRALEVYLEALEFHPQNVALLLEAGRLYQENGLTTRSIEMYERALTINPQQVEALAGQAHNYTTLGFYSKARYFYDQFFALSTAISPVDRADYANTFLRQRDYQNAFIHITLALEQTQTNPDFWQLSAQALRGLGKSQEALQDLNIAILLAPKRTDFLAQKALWLYEKNEYTSSLQVVQQLLKQKPDNSLALLIQALNWQKQGKTKQAKQQLNQIAQAESSASFVGRVAQKLAAQK